MTEQSQVPAEFTVKLDRQRWTDLYDTEQMASSCPFDSDSTFISILRYLDGDDLDEITARAAKYETEGVINAYARAQLEVTVVDWGGTELLEKCRRLKADDGTLKPPGTDTVGGLTNLMRAGTIEFETMQYGLKRRPQPIVTLAALLRTLPDKHAARKHLTAALEAFRAEAAKEEGTALAPAQFPGERAAVADAGGQALSDGEAAP